MLLVARGSLGGGRAAARDAFADSVHAVDEVVRCFIALDSFAADDRRVLKSQRFSANNNLKDQDLNGQPR